MLKKCLVILEVSQKQAYIFQYKRLANNIDASDLICYVTSKEFFEKEARDLFTKENMVYDGGGHTILEFPTREAAVLFTRRISKRVMEKFKGLEIFTKIIDYKEDMTPAENEKLLIQELEKKKSLRQNSFYQGNFGIERMAEQKKEEKTTERKEYKKENSTFEIDFSKFTYAKKLEDLGGTKNSSNFIAIIHIDGNLMGKRVGNLVSQDFSKFEEITEKSEKGWNAYKQVKEEFSANIDLHFKEAFQDMIDIVQRAYENEKLNELDLRTDKNEKIMFPVRRIINAGDDVCFVTEGRIGVECAVAYLKSIWKKTNGVDEKNYSACAGVAIVHQKYPFYKAYELAEQLCSNAKKFIAGLDENASANVCAIDWHIEYGEMENGLSNIREQYITTEGNHMEMRPYIVCGDEHLVRKERKRHYENFKTYMHNVQNKEIVARGKMKQLRTVLKGDEQVAMNYIKTNHMEDLIWDARDCYHLEETNQAEKLFYTTYDGNKRNMIFDALELMDTFVELEE